jgi:excisionase family DNA binding protein
MMHEQQETAPAAPMTGSFLTTSDVQRLIRVDRSTIYRMAEAGRIPAVKVGRQWRFQEQRLREWLEGGLPSAAAVDRAAPATVPAAAFQAVADLLAEFSGTMVVLTDIEGRLLAEVARPCGLFSALHGQAGVLERCVASWQQLAADVDLEPRWTVTPLGFLCARSLFRVGPRLGGMVLAGGVAPTQWPPSVARLRELAGELAVPLGLIRGHVGEVYRLTTPERDRVLRLLPRTAAVLSHLAATSDPTGTSQRSPT